MSNLREPLLKITTEDVARAVPLPPARPLAVAAAIPLPLYRPARSGTSGLAIASLVVAVLGIALFGVITGLVAIALGSIALGSIRNAQQRGTGLAVCGILLGMADVVGWLVFLSFMLSGGGPNITLDDLEPDAGALENLAPHISRAVMANVLIETQGDWKLLGGKGIGSGVILRIRDGQALVVTNRHVVDHDFSGDAKPAGQAMDASRLQVKLVGQPAQPGMVVWIAPDGVDLALLNVPVLGDQAQAAQWQAHRRLIVGEDVFCIGNPQHLDWSHTRGTISQLRFQTRGSRKIHVIQTDAAINPGNSGGGLYDKDGVLIGINTWTNDKRVSEGLSFAIAFESLLSLNPPPLQLQAEKDPPSKP